MSVIEGQPPRCVLVCQNTSCQRQNSFAVLQAFQTETEQMSDVTVIASDCLGQCSTGPTVKVTPDQIWYYRVQVADVKNIVQSHLIQGQPVKQKLNPRIHLSFG